MDQSVFERLKEEYSYLHEKFEKLKTFIESPDFEKTVIEDEKPIIKEQFEVMKKYLSMIEKRINIHS